MKYDKDGVIISDSLNGLGDIYKDVILRLMPCGTLGEHVNSSSMEIHSSYMKGIV